VKNCEGGGGDLRGKVCCHLLEEMKAEMVMQEEEFEVQEVVLMVEVGEYAVDLEEEILVHCQGIQWDQRDHICLVQVVSLDLYLGCEVEGWEKLSEVFSRFEILKV